MKLLTRYKRLTLWNKIAFWGSLASILSVIFFFITKNDSVIVNSNNQKGGITAGNIESLQITNVNPQNNAIESEQIRKDQQLALIYQSEPLHQFKTCLRWTLPLGNNVDYEIDEVFNYGINFAEGINYVEISTKIVSKIFTKYDFTKPMVNFYSETDFKPTGFNNVLGMLEYFDEQLINT